MPRRQRGDGRRHSASESSRAGRDRALVANQLLGLFPADAAAALAPYFEPVNLEQQEVLFRANEPLRVVYFPGSAVVSLVARLESGEALEVGLVGREGIVGTAVFPGIATVPYDAVVMIPGTAQRMSADVLRRALADSQPLHSVVGRFTRLLLVRSMQLSACNLFHTVEQRCIRWLLTVNDLMGDSDIPLTHELLATMLGVHRPTVTLAIRALHHAGLVEENRGRILLRDRQGLEDACCECYRVMRDEQRRLLGY